MPQLSLYMNDAVMDSLRRCAAAEGVSLSSYAASVIRRATDGSSWPASYWESVYGCLPDGFSVDDSDLDPSLDDSCDWFE